MTMNSLFYNVHTKSVEDHCNRVALFIRVQNRQLNVGLRALRT
jgi:hypothetical protein